ncbi:MAG: ATP/GTP-binding protein [Clostridia bacterium]|nr:ATP/GTP-binding protein [Clostridia bacterium]
MIASVSVSNFRSFNKTETFSMEAGKTRNFSERIYRSANSRILKFKAVYGPNASGKSGLIKVLEFIQTAIVDGIPNNSTMDYCRLNDDNINRPSQFEIEIVIDNYRYIYGFQVLLSESKFIKEWLYEQKSAKRRLVFTRDIQRGEFDVDSYTTDVLLNERLKIYASDIKQDSSVLFLNVMNQNKDSLYGLDSKIKIYRTLYRWFKFKLCVGHPDDPLTQYTYFFGAKGSAAIEKVLERFDTGISKVMICDEPMEKVIKSFPKPFLQEILDNLTEQQARYLRQNRDDTPAVAVRDHEDHSIYLIELNGDDVCCKTLQFSHTHSNSYFMLKEESDGTRRLLDLMEILLAKANNIVYAIDEISRCLHPIVTKQFVRDFLDMAVERNIQLIATTHETDLMDLELLRQDEIGFVEKNDTDGSSHIFNLEDYGARFDKRIRTAYMKGQYDAIPKIKELT